MGRPHRHVRGWLSARCGFPARGIRRAGAGGRNAGVTATVRSISWERLVRKVSSARLNCFVKIPPFEPVRILHFRHYSHFCIVLPIYVYVYARR